MYTQMPSALEPEAVSKSLRCSELTPTAQLCRISPRRTALLGLLSLVALPGCGGKTNNTPPPFTLTVSIATPTLTIQAGGQPVLQPVTIMAPTETTSFVVSGLPAGLNATYKPSESNPSGLMTLTANSSATVGTTRPVITVGTQGETATTSFSLVVTAAKSSFE